MELYPLMHQAADRDLDVFSKLSTYDITSDIAPCSNICPVWDVNILFFNLVFAGKVAHKNKIKKENIDIPN